MSMEKEIDFPKEYKDMIGKGVTYESGNKKIIGTVQGLRWKPSIISNIHNPSERYYGIQVLIKPENGKARWTNTLNSGVKVGSK